MKIIVLCFCFTFSLTALAQQASPTLPHEDARFVYLEVEPNSDKEITIQAIKCDPMANEISVQTFISESQVANASVNVLNVYARAGDCEESNYSSLWTEKIKLPKNGNYSQVYITILSNSISVQ